MKTVCVLTATRAEYGLLRNLILKLQSYEQIHVKVAVTGTHLSDKFGFTYNEIKNDGIVADCCIPILEEFDSCCASSQEMGRALTLFGQYFEQSQPDMLIVLGDRYETIAVCLAAMTQKIPIAHIHGGEKTEGAIDEVIRHAISKLSYLHFTSTEEYRRRVIQLGENPERVFNVGALSVENIVKQQFISKVQLEEFLQFHLGSQYAVVTFHPVTLEDNTIEVQMQELVEALQHFTNLNYIITKANADTGGRYINELWEQYQLCHPTRFKVVDSLGVQRYLSAIKGACMVIGNSSSGITEAPILHVPTINIGDRQKGRLRVRSILDCGTSKEQIIGAISEALSKDFLDKIQKQQNIYGEGNTSELISSTVKEFLINGKINLKKIFYDIM